MKSGLQALSMPKTSWQGDCSCQKLSPKTLNFTAWEELSVPNWKLSAM